MPELPATTRLNPSLMLTATFQLKGESEGDSADFGYSLKRYPEMREALLGLLNNDPAAAFSALGPGLIEDLASKDLLQISATASGKMRFQPENIIGLAPQVILSMLVFARFANAPAQRKLMVLSAHRGASIWLLQALADPDVAASYNELGTPELETLTTMGALVDTDPPPIVEFPQAGDDVDAWQRESAQAENVLVQRKGEPIPARVLQLLGTKMPDLPDDHILWSCDTVTRTPFPSVIPASAIDQLVTDSTERAKQAPVIERKEHWRNTINVAKVEYKKQAYAQLNEIIPAAQRPALREHVRRLIPANYFGPIGDSQVDRRMSMHSEPVTGSIHMRLAKLVSNIVGRTVLPSYSFLGCYHEGSVLRRHTDRPSCQYNLSIVYDMCDLEGNPVEPWPIYLHANKKTVACNLEPGSGVVYRGTDIEHWRDALPAGQRAIVCFYHFVNEDFKGSLL